MPSNVSKIPDAGDVSSIQSSSDVNHDNTTGGTDANAHHTEPSAGTFVTDEATNQFGFATEDFVRQQSTHKSPIVALDDGDSYEIVAKIPDGKTLTVYEAVALRVDTSTAGGSADANLNVDLVDQSGGESVVYSDTGENLGSAGSPVNDGTNDATISNSSGSPTYALLRMKNTSGDGTAFNSPGCIAVFGVVIE